MSDRLDDGAVFPGDGAIGDAPTDSYAFAERIVYAALENARRQFEIEPKHWDWLLCFVDAVERENVRGFMAARPFTIRYGYQRDTNAWPVIGLTLAAEKAEEEFLDMALDLGVKGEVRRQMIDIIAYSDNPNLTLYLYHWINYAMIAHIEWMQRSILIDPRFESGGEIAPDPRLLPETCYLRRMQWSFGGIVSVALPMPAPSRDLYAANTTALVNGHVGRVTGERT